MTSISSYTFSMEMNTGGVDLGSRSIVSNLKTVNSALEQTGTVADSTAADLAAFGEGARRAAKSAELFEATRLRSQASSGKGSKRGSVDPVAESMSRFKHEPVITPLSKYVEAEAAHTAATAAGAANRDNIRNQELLRERELAALREDMISRSATMLAQNLAAERAMRDNAWNEEELAAKKHAMDLVKLKQDIQSRLPPVSNQRLLTGMSEAGAAQAQSGSFANRITNWQLLESSRTAARIDAEQRVERIAAGAAAGRARQVIAYIREQEQARIDAEQRVERIAAGAAAGRARQVIAYIREQEQARIDAEQRVERIAAGAAAGRARQVIAYIREQEQARIDAEQRVERIAAGAAAGRARQVIAYIREQEQARIDAEQRVERIAAGAAAGRARQVIAYIREQEQARIDAEQRVERIAAAAAAARARQSIAAIRQQQQGVQDDANIGRSIGLIGRLQGADAMLTARMGPMTREFNQAEQSIANMRAQLEPMVGMEMHLANEARQFRNYIREAVVAGTMQLNRAEALTAEFQQQQALLRQHVAKQQEGFVGMRRMGFAAQQFGYAIEDAASVYGTMGLAGAFRAAGNNLTQIAAQVNWQTGVVASLASAAIALAINFSAAKKRADELKKSIDTLAESRSKFTSDNDRQLQLEYELSEARKGGVKELESAYDSLASAIQRTSQQIESAARTQAQTQAVENAIKRVEELNKLASERSSQWWSENFKTVIQGWEYIRDKAISTYMVLDDLITHLSATLGEVLKSFDLVTKGDFSGAADKLSGAKAAGDRAIAEKRQMEMDRRNADLKMENELRLQEKALKDLLDPEKQRLKLMQEQWGVLKDQSSEISTNLHSVLATGPALQRDISFMDRESGKYDVRTPDSMLVRSTFNDKRGNLGQKTFIADTDRELAVALHKIERDRDRLMLLRDQSTSLDDQKKLSDEIASRNEELLRIDQMRVDLNAAGKSSLEETNQSIMGRYEGLNEELRIENEVLRTRKKINEEIDIAVRSGHVNGQQADKYRAELESVLKLEEQRRNNEKEIANLQKREGRLESLAREAMTPATVAAGLTKGSDEARAFLENERLKSMAMKDAEPQIKELRDIKAEIKRLRESNEKIGQSKPGVVTLT